MPGLPACRRSQGSRIDDYAPGGHRSGPSTMSGQWRKLYIPWPTADQGESPAFEYRMTAARMGECAAEPCVRRSGPRGLVQLCQD
jgi:hypothetical protein